MNVAYNQTIIKISKDDIPPTLHEFINMTLPEHFENKSLPFKYTLCYLDRKDCPITVMNEKNYQTMRQVMEVMNAREDDLRLVIVPEHIIKVEEGADELPIRNINRVGPVVDETASARHNQNPQSNAEPSQNNLEGAGNNQQADRSPIINPHAVEEEVPAQVNENPQNMAEPVQENLMNIENDQEVPSPRIYTHENLQWIVNEVNEAEIKKRKRRNSKKKNKGNECSKLQNEVRYLEKNKPQREIWKDLEDGLEKNMKSSRVATFGASQEQSQVINKSFDDFQEKWKKYYRFETDFKRGFLKVTARQELITSSRSKPNTTISDRNVIRMMNELLKALETDDLKVTTLALNFANCLRLSKSGVSSLFDTINKEFRGVQTLILDFSFNSLNLEEKKNANKCEIIIDLPHLEVLSLDFYNRCDITPEETFMMIESLGKNTKDSLNTLRFFLPGTFYVKQKAIKEVGSKLNFVEDKIVLPLLK